MRVLFMSSEVAPYSKTGGLGDVSGALPAALAARGIDVRVVTPLYASVDRGPLERTGLTVRLRFPFGEEVGRLWRHRRSARHQVLFVEHEGFFGRPGIYGERASDYPDNYRRFGFFSVAALAAAESAKWIPDLVHLNDWQTGLAAVALRRGYQGRAVSTVKSVLTIHNLAYQGLSPKSALDDLGLPWELFTPEALEFHDQVNLLKAGIAFSDALTTVSKKYAEEICTPEGGWGLDGMLRARRDSLHGILNGVDTEQWDPRRDPALPARFDAKQLAGKMKCKAALLERFGLASAAALERPLFVTVGRLAVQKGVDLLLDALPRVLSRPMTFLALGSGEPRYEEGMRALAAAHPGKVAVKIGFDEPLSHLMEAGGDFFVMPSQYEPCGLNQMYSLLYGTVPIVRATGGLDDTVIDASSPKGNGIKFGPYSAAALEEAFARALAIYPDQRTLLALRRRGMAGDYSWTHAAAGYERLYRRLAGGRARAKALLRPSRAPARG